MRQASRCALGLAGLMLSAGVLEASGPRVTPQDAFNEEDLGERWIYDDVQAGLAEAKRTGKPLLAAFR